MDLAGLLFNAASGGVLGSALHCVTDYFDTKNKVTLMNAQVAAAEKTEAWKAFAESQTGANDHLVIPTGLPTWVSSFYVLVDGLKQLTRPLLTWASVAMILTVYLRSTPAVQAEITAEITFGSFTAIFWWFGARYAKNK